MPQLAADWRAHSSVAAMAAAAAAACFSARWPMDSGPRALAHRERAGIPPPRPPPRVRPRAGFRCPVVVEALGVQQRVHEMLRRGKWVGRGVGWQAQHGLSSSRQRRLGKPRRA